MRFNLKIKFFWKDILLVNYKNISEIDFSSQLSLQIYSTVMWSETIKTILKEDK